MTPFKIFLLHQSLWFILILWSHRNDLDGLDDMVTVAMGAFCFSAPSSVAHWSITSSLD